MTTESKLIPVLREGIDIIKMILFKKLQAHLSQKYPTQDSTTINRITGAVLNELFGTPSTEEPYVSFAQSNRALIDEELTQLATCFPELRIPLTDALRIQFLCDSQDGIDSENVLERARELGVLIVDRDLPLPAPFMNLVRKLGNSFDILAQV